MTKSGPFGPNPTHETLFLAHFVAKGGPFGRFGEGCVTPPCYGPLFIMDMGGFEWVTINKNAQKSILSYMFELCLWN